MADIAGLFDNTYCSQSDSHAYECRVRAVLNQLYSWRWSWQARNHNTVFQLNTNDLSPFDTTIHYASPILVYEIWLYNALLILVLGLLAPFEPKIGDNGCSHLISGPLLLPWQTKSPKAAANEICRCFEYQLLNLDAQSSVHEWAMPLALAYVTLDPTDPVAIWVLGKINSTTDGHRLPWLLHIGRLKGIDKDVTGNASTRWPISKVAR